MAYEPYALRTTAWTPPVPMHLRRYVQATLRAERHRIAYEAAVLARGEHLAAIIAAGISQRDLAGLTGLSRRRIRDLIADANADQLVAQLAAESS